MKEGIDETVVGRPFDSGGDKEEHSWRNELSVDDYYDEEDSLIAHKQKLKPTQQQNVPWRCLLALARCVQSLIGFILIVCAVDSLSVPLWAPETEVLEDVTLMVLVTEVDIPNIPRRIEGLSSSLGASIGANRFFLVDAHKTNGHVSPELRAVMQDAIRSGFLDGFMIFNESAYDSQARDAHFGSTMRNFENIGNAVYYYMVETCRTKYLVHYDLDVHVWHRPGRSWVADGRRILESSKDIWILTPPSPFYHHMVARFDFGGVLFRVLRVFFGWRFVEFMGSDYVNSQVYLLDAHRGREILQSFPVTPKVREIYSSGHWETTTKTLMVAANYRYRRVSLADCTAYWGLHYSTKDADHHLVPIPELAKQGYAVTKENKVFSPAPVSEWEHALQEVVKQQESNRFLQCMFALTLVVLVVQRCIAAAPTNGVKA